MKEIDKKWKVLGDFSMEGRIRVPSPATLYTRGIIE